MKTVTNPRTNLAAAVETRIDELGLEYAEAAKRAGISVETLAKIRRGDRVRSPTLRKLEQGLGLPNGWATEFLGPDDDISASPSTPPVEQEDHLPVARLSEPQTPVALSDVEDWVEGINWWPSRRDPERIIVYRLRWLGGPDRLSRKEFVTEAPPETPLSVMVEYLEGKRNEDLN